MKSDSLHRLIQSLDRGEQRFSRSAVAAENGAKTEAKLLLFDTLWKMNEYDSEKLKLAVKGTEISANLAVEKVRMFHWILDSVRLLHERRTDANDPYKRLQEGKVLLELALLEEAEEVVLKGIATAVATEELMAEVPLRELLRVIYKNMNDKSFTKLKTDNEYLLEMASKKLTTVVRYTQINDRAYDYIRRYRVTDKEGVKSGMEELITRPEMTDINMANSLPAQQRYFDAWNFYHSSRNELELAVTNLERVYRLWEANPARIKLHSGLYIGTISNLVGKLNVLGRFDDSLAYIKKMENIKVNTRRMEIYRFGSLELQYQLFYMNRGKLTEALAREDIINKGIRGYGKALTDSSKLTLLYNLGITHLICDNAGKALRYFNAIKNLGELRDRTDLQGVSRLLRLILLEDQEDSVNFGHYLRNSKRFFTTKDRAYSLENLVHDWLHIQNKLMGIAERKESYENLSDTVYPLIAKGILGAEEIFIWASAKKRGIKALSVFKERLQSQ